ncbi:hypothetical protein [Actinoplanes sp. L3-i22]|uniref:hypothetical protein n=1 Tax=Actinoplanes sp. L3-i22 TaxID=2836373 RepID=UPI001C741CAD|nr:hypothetical protein [Actinoplanes sp. L3-i22]BCY06667.1 hypothetical protein L3i22_017550 [Actinoplanes sp. L3-i22]
MEPTSSPDNARPAPGLARFWQVRPDAEAESSYLPSAYLPPAEETREAEPVPEPEMVSLGSRRAIEPELTLPPLPIDLMTGSSRPFGPHPGSPFAPIASARGPHGPGDANGFHGTPGELPGSDPFGLNRAAGRVPGPGRSDRGGTPPTRPRHGDSDHSVPSDHEPEPGQDVESREPEAETPGRDTSFGGFRLGGTGRFLFGGRAPDAHAGVNGHTSEAEASAAEETPGDAQVAESPADEESTGAAPEDEPADDTSPEAGQDPAEEAGPRDENGREHMNGRAGAPGYAQPGDMPGQDEAPVADGPLDEPVEVHPAAGWASVPVQPPTSGGPAGPVSGAPVSPGYAPAPYLPTDFTPDHPASTLTPEPNGEQPAPVPLDPAASAAPVSPAQPLGPVPPLGQAQPAGPVQPFSPAPPTAPGPPPAPVTGSATMQLPELVYPTPTHPAPMPQIPATRAPSDLPQSTETGFAFGSPATTGYSLGRSGEAFGVASVTPAAPQAGSVTPPPLEFQPYPESGLTGVSVGGLRRGLVDDERPAARRSASLEDAEPVRRPGRRAAAEDDDLGSESSLGGEEGAIIRPNIWDEDAARHFRAAWHEVKAEFVDDPVNALTRAHDLLTDAVNELTEVLLAERDDLDPLRGTGTTDTESMRMAMRGYREFLDRILSL